MNTPTPCRIVRYHFTVVNDDGKLEHRSRPAIITSVGASDDVLNLHVFFEPGDFGDPYHNPALSQFGVHPFDPSNPISHRWSWPPRT